MRITNPVGVLGEDIAVEYLKEKGYKIIDRNFRKSYGEIDIIALAPTKPLQTSPTPIKSGFFPLLSGEGTEEVLVFIEVKTRKTDSFGTPFESITPRKLRELVKTAQFYSLAHPRLPQSMRIDAISVVLNSENKIDRIEHVENITV